MKLLSDTELGYAAGIFDSRLHFRLCPRRGAELRVAHTEAVTRWLARNLGGKQYEIKSGYEWRLYRKRDIANVLHYVQPHMVDKQSAARTVRDFCAPPPRKG